MNENLRKQDGDAKEFFNFTEWLTNEVKLPQYAEIFRNQGFEQPSDCSGIDETVLDILGIVKIGHRKRLLGSCQRLADRYGLSSDVATAAKTGDGEIEEKQSATENVDPFGEGDVGEGEGDAPPVLPPKKINLKKLKPPPPPRKLSLETEQEVLHVNGSAMEGQNNVSAGDRTESTELELDVVNPPVTELRKDEKVTADAMNNAEISTSDCPPGLPSGTPMESYERIWDYNEGEPLPISPDKTAQESFDGNSISKTGSDNISSESWGQLGVSMNTGIDSVSVVDNKQTSESLIKVPEEPPPIPPRVDLDSTSTENLLYETVSEESSNVTTDNTAKLAPEPAEQKPEEKSIVRRKKNPPKKPPRSNKPKPVSMFIQSTNPVPCTEPRRSFGQSNIHKSNEEDIYENEVFSPKRDGPKEQEVCLPEEKVSVPDAVNNPEQTKDTDTSHDDDHDDGNIYGNVEQPQKVPLQQKTSIPILDSKGLLKRPIPAPRIKSVSEKPKASPGIGIAPDSGGGVGDGGSCTDDDLSGSDEEEMPAKTESTYETVDFPLISPSTPQSRRSYKDGYLFKQGGQQNNKGWKKRWVVFDGNELRYYKDKEHTNESLQVVPLTIMQELRIVTEDTKRSRFDLACSGRTYMFALGSDEMDIIQMWAQVLMVSILDCKFGFDGLPSSQDFTKTLICFCSFEKDKDNQNDITTIPGGDMFDPDKKGFLKKQGNNVVVDWKKRFVAIKDGKFAYYHNYEDFVHASPINTLQMNLATVKLDPRYQTRFQLITPHRTYMFQCEDDGELRAWIAAMEKAIQLALSDRKVINTIWENESNRYCADCGKKDPLWASVNLVVCVCAHCIGVHRKLGVHTSKPRSLLMDEKIWKPSLMKLMVELGNAASNKFWKFTFPEDDQIAPDCSSEERVDFIRKKYEEKRYRHISPLYGDNVALGEALRKVVQTNDIQQTMQLVFCGADMKYVSADSDDNRTPYELAQDANQELQMEFLMQNGANAESDPVQTSELSNNGDDTYETPFEVVRPPMDQASNVPVTYEKVGFLHKKAPSAAVWRKRNFALKGRELWYDKGDKEDRGVIKLKDVEEYIYNNSVTLDIVTPERTYNLRADTKEEAFDWYTALRNKQVFQIPLALQELGSDGIPHLVAKCLQFIETHGIDTEGIYRKNGNKAKIKKMRRLFDQDAESVLLSREEYEVHDVAGLLKEYFRELPDPLMTEDAYPHFVTASISPDHNTKLHMYKNGLGRLPEVNRNTLKTVLSHLARVCSHSAENLMKLENISLIFGPTLMSNKQMGGMDTNTINKEFSVLGDFITYYKWLFDVRDDELLKDQKMEEAMKKIGELALKNSQLEVNELTLDVYSLALTQESSRITVNSSTKASQICQEVVSKRAMPPDGNWALFQVVNGELERPFQATEKVLATALETGKYTQLSKGSSLIVKENYVSQKMQAYGFQDDKSLIAASTIQTMKETKKNWKKLFIKLEKGVLSVYKNAKSKDDIDNWPVNETTLYLGVGKDKKPLTRFGFTIARSMKDNQCVYRYVCLEDEREQYRWISVFLRLKHPGKQLWVDPELEPIGYYAEAMIPRKSPPLPRMKSNTRLLPGGSANVLNELRQKQQRQSVRKK